eukprot:6309614-Prymnesium_polylepis.1
MHAGSVTAQVVCAQRNHTNSVCPGRRSPPVAAHHGLGATIDSARSARCPFDVDFSDKDGRVPCRRSAPEASMST